MAASSTAHTPDWNASHLRRVCACQRKGPREPHGDRDEKIIAMYARGMTVREIQGFLPSDDAATKLIWAALKNITADWSRSTREWSEAMNQFAIAHGDRFARMY